MSNGAEFNAGNITLNEKIFDNPNLIAAARVEIDVDGNPLDNRAIGDTNNLKEFLNLQDKNIAGLGGVTFTSYLNNIVGKVGLQVQELTNEAEAQSAILEQATTNFYSLGGVNLDEELMDMIKYQRAYEASSRIFSVCNQMLQVLVSLGE
jgi:flagellar hook-associated protein 1 FlgK